MSQGDSDSVVVDKFQCDEDDIGTFGAIGMSLSGLEAVFNAYNEYCDTKKHVGGRIN